MGQRIGFGWASVWVLVFLVCAAMPGRAQDPPLSSATGNVEAHADTATVVFFRGIMMLGAAVGYTIYEDRVSLGKLKNGTYFSVQLPSGKHQFVVNSWKQYPLSLDIEAGKTYYVRGTMSTQAPYPVLRVEPQSLFDGMKPVLKDVGVKPKD
jgi:hypothetical protein